MQEFVDGVASKKMRPVDCKKRRNPKKKIELTFVIPKMGRNQYIIVPELYGEQKKTGVDVVSMLGPEKETINHAHAGDYIVTGPINEMYVIQSKKIDAKYGRVDGTTDLLPVDEPRQVIKIDQPVYDALKKKYQVYQDTSEKSKSRSGYFNIQPSYSNDPKQQMKLKLGDVIVYKNDSKNNEFYRIHQLVYKGDYEETKKQGR